jgi:hypothetical protein
MPQRWGTHETSLPQNLERILAAAGTSLDDLENDHLPANMLVQCDAIAVITHEG